MSGFEQTKVSDLRTELINLHGYSEEKAGSIIGKSNLVYEVLQQRETTEKHPDIVETTQTFEPSTPFAPFETPEEDNPAHDLIDIFSDSELEEEKIEVSGEQEEEIVIPEYGSKEWQDFIISELHENEIYKENPLHTGLRRLTEKYLGDIVSSGPVDVMVTNDINHPGRATVIYEIVILWRLGTPSFVTLDHTSEKRTFRAVAECWTGNSPATFAVHPAATAETKAASRAFKTALMLNIHTSEEMENDKDPVDVVSETHEALFGRQNDWEGHMKISGTQKTFIVDRCNELGIDVDKFMNIEYYCYTSSEDKEKSEPKYTELDQVSKEVAKLMIGEINKYQSNTGTKESKLIPPVILLEKKV